MPTQSHRLLGKTRVRNCELVSRVWSVTYVVLTKAHCSADIDSRLHMLTDALISACLLIYDLVADSPRLRLSRSQGGCHQAETALDRTAAFPVGDLTSAIPILGMRLLGKRALAGETGLQSLLCSGMTRLVCNSRGRR